MSGLGLRTLYQGTVHLLDTLKSGAINSHGVIRLSLVLITPPLFAGTDSSRHFAIKWPLLVLSQETAQMGFPNKLKTHRNHVNVAQLFIQFNR